MRGCTGVGSQDLPFVNPIHTRKSREQNHHDSRNRHVSGVGFRRHVFFLFFGTGRFFLKLQALCLVCRGGVSVKKQQCGIRVIIQGCYHPCYPYIQQQHDPTTSSWCTKQPFCYCTKHFCSVFGNTPSLGTSLYTIIEGLTIKAWNHSDCKAQALQGLRQANRFVELRGVGQHREKVISCMFRLEVGKSHKFPHEKWNLSSSWSRNLACFNS